ncbi:MAG: hypothetical protein VX672_05320 [Planctomycetota bacterium]|nr:hypothetical protein [Planctomycetota bacterium]
MRTDSGQLLRRLEPVVRPTGIGPIGSAPESIETAGFDDLLARAERGEFQSGRELDDRVLRTPLDDRTRERMARIADAAETAGHGRILVIAEDRPILLEVAERRVEGELGRTAGGDAPEETLRPIDAAVRLRSLEHEDEPIIDGPSARIMPPAIADAILAGGDLPNSVIAEDGSATHDARDDAA